MRNKFAYLSYLLLLLVKCIVLTLLETFRHSREMERNLYIIYFFILYVPNCSYLLFSPCCYSILLHLFKSSPISDLYKYLCTWVNETIRILYNSVYLLYISQLLLRSRRLQSHSHYNHIFTNKTVIFHQYQSHFVKTSRSSFKPSCFLSICIVTRPDNFV